MARRKFSLKGYEHICQISVDGCIIFYKREDYLVFYTLVRTFAQKYNIHITGLCIMRNHIHMQAQFSNRRQMASFMDALLSSFARIYNNHYRLHGKLFKHSYNSSPKYSDKRIAENHFYICNNPVVKMAVENAQDYMWTFLKPQEPKITNKSLDLLKAELTVGKLKDLNKCVPYSFFRKLKLNADEYNDLCEYIINTYNFIDYQPFIDKHGSLSKYLKAVNLVSGSEYDLADDTSQEDYRHYDAMDKILKINPMTLPMEERLKWDAIISQKVPSTEYERHKYLHIQ